MGLYLRKKLLSYLAKEKPTHRYPLSDFDRIKHELKQGDILLIEGSSTISQIIQNLTKSAWSHCAIYIGKKHDIEDSAFREKISTYSNFTNDTPLVIEGYMGKGIFIDSFSKYKGYHIRICRPKGIAHSDIQKVMNYCLNAVGRDYDIRHIVDILRFLFPWKLFPAKWGSVLFKRGKRMDKAICSSLIAEAFESVQFPILPDITTDKKKGIRLIRRNPMLFWPSHFDYSPYFEIIKYPMLNLSDHPLYKSLPWQDEENP